MNSMSQQLQKPYTTKQYAFAIPPNKAKSQVTAPAIPPLAFLLSLFRSGISSIPELYNTVSSIPSFNWQNQADIDKYLNPATRQKINGQDVDFWASVKQKPWNAQNSVAGSDPMNKTTSAYVGPVLNQGDQGQCYAVSSTDVLTMRYAIQNDLDNSNNQELFNIGEVVSRSSDPSVFNTTNVGECPSQNQGVNGGFPACVGAYVQAMGIHKNSACPFNSGPCNSCVPAGDNGCTGSNCCSSATYSDPNQINGSPAVLYRPVPLNPPSVTLPNGKVEKTKAIVNFVQYYNAEGTLVNPVPNPTDLQRKELQQYMKLHLMTQGPMVTCFFAEDPDFQSYSGGVFVGQNPGQEPDHAVVIVGWGTSTSGPYIGEYWIVKNSWGTSWGDTENPGYFNFAMSKTSDGTNVGYYMDYPAVLPSGNSCTAEGGGCDPLNICINGQCYNMFGGGTGFLVNGMEAIDVPSLTGAGPTQSASLISTRESQQRCRCGIDPGCVVCSGSQSPNPMGAAAAFPSSASFEKQDFSPVPSSYSAVSTTATGPKFYNNGSTEPSGCYNFNTNIFVVDLPKIIHTRTKHMKKINIDRLMKHYNSCIEKRSAHLKHMNEQYNLDSIHSSSKSSKNHKASKNGKESKSGKSSDGGVIAAIVILSLVLLASVIALGIVAARKK